jgi:hypothetical protein
MDDVVTPRFFSRKREGKVTFNPMTKVRRFSEVVDGGQGAWYRAIAISCPATGAHFEVEHVDNAFGWYLNPIYPTPITIPTVTIIPEKEVSDLITEVCTKCAAERGKADNNLFESVAEYKQTLRMFLKPQNSLFKFFNKNGKKMSKLSPENAWLAYRYGLKPFIKDVSGIIEGLSKTTGLKRVTTRAKGEISRQESINTVSTRGVTTVTINNQTIDTVRVRAMSLDEYVATTASNIGFTAKGLITVPWELVPYSFVADWFVNVGDYLNALAPAPGYNQLGSCYTVERITSNIYTPVSTTIVSGSGYENPPLRPVSGTLRSVLETKTRSALVTPGLIVKNNFKLTDAVRAADAIALLKQQADRIFQRKRHL